MGKITPWSEETRNDFDIRLQIRTLCSKLATESPQAPSSRFDKSKTGKSSAVKKAAVVVARPHRALVGQGKASKLKKASKAEAGTKSSKATSSGPQQSTDTS